MLDIVGKDQEKFFESLSNIAPRTRFGIEKAFWRSGKDIQQEFIKQVKSKVKSGVIYRLRIRPGGRLKYHKSSGPGETPANLSGKYLRGFGFIVSGSNQLAIGNTEEHSLYLEVGTSRMAKRPGLRNSINSSQRNIIRNFTTEIEKAL